MRPKNRFLPSLALVVAAIAHGETPAKETRLFDGKSLAGWSLVTEQPSKIAEACKVTPEGALSVTGKPVGYLLAEGTYENYQLHVEWRWPADAKKSSNSGILVNIGSGPVDKGWPTCLQVQMKLNHAGDFLPMAGFTFAEPLSTPPNAKTPQLDGKKLPAEKPLGEWNSAEVICRGGRIEATVNGIPENVVTGCKPASGQVGFQFEGTPFELRNVVISPLP